MFSVTDRSECSLSCTYRSHWQEGQVLNEEGRFFALSLSLSPRFTHVGGKEEKKKAAPADSQACFVVPPNQENPCPCAKALGGFSKHFRSPLALSIMQVFK